MSNDTTNLQAVSSTPEDIFIIDPSEIKYINSAVLQNIINRARGLLALLEVSGEQEEEFLISHKVVLQNLYHLSALLEQADKVLDHAKS